MSPTMSQKLLWATGLVPLFVVLFLQLWNPITLESATKTLNTLLGRDPVSSARSQTPIIMAAIPHFSHIEKITTIAEGLIGLGYPVSFITSPEFKTYIESIGATYIPIEGGHQGMMSDEDMATFMTLGGDELEIFATNAVFIKTIPSQHRTIQQTFNHIRKTYGKNKKLITVFDCAFSGLSPVMLGAPGVRPDAAIAVGLAPFPAASNDTFPFRSGRQPDTSSESQQIHFDAQKLQYKDPIDSQVNAALNVVLEDMGVTRTPPSIYDMFGTSSDIYLQYGIPAFEYKRRDVRPNLLFMGAPVAVGIADRAFPEWWGDVLEARAAGKQIVAITSSSVSFDTNSMIVPALEAFKDRADVFVVATLVTSDVEHLNIQIPGNARISKFIPLDLVLPEVSVLISNGGYGTVQQALRAGVPLILSGVGQDKLHTGALIEYTGVGIYHAVPKVTAEMLTAAFDTITKNQTYRATSKAFAKQYDRYNAIEVVDTTIQKVLSGDI